MPDGDHRAVLPNEAPAPQAADASENNGKSMFTFLFIGVDMGAKFVFSPLARGLGG